MGEVHRHGDEQRKVKTVGQDHNFIINGCSVNLRLLTNQELMRLIHSQEIRLASLRDENNLLVQESIRRSDLLSIHDTPTMF